MSPGEKLARELTAQFLQNGSLCRYPTDGEAGACP